MKYILSLFFFFCTFFSFTFAFSVEDSCEEKIFIVTAYYSPLSWQSFYYKPTYQDEVILNGSGIAWASGKKVFNWMLAAPSSYSFWDKVVFPWLWVWEVADRWWAIVEDGERWNAHDRIDIWMWKGEEWLVRALTFWKKTLTWYYCSKDLSWISQLKPSIAFSSVPILKHFFDVALFIQELKPERTDIWVYTLQKYLSKLWYLSEKKQTWYFWAETKKALCSYQIKKGIASKKTCWTFWSTTRYKMKLDVQNKWLFPEDLWETSSIASLKTLATTYVSSVRNSSWIPSWSSFFTVAYRKNEKHDKIGVLQSLLKNLGLYSWSINSTYTNATIQSVYAFQLQKWILTIWEKSSAKWWLWPSTREALNDMYISSWSLSSTTWFVAPLIKKTAFQFYRPYKKWDKNAEIKILQNFLQEQWFYSWTIDSVYSSSIITALYNFQLQYWLITEKDSVSLRWYLWPNTRKKINEMIN